MTHFQEFLIIEILCRVKKHVTIHQLFTGCMAHRAQHKYTLVVTPIGNASPPFTINGKAGKVKYFDFVYKEEPFRKKHLLFYEFKE